MARETLSPSLPFPLHPASVAGGGRRRKSEPTRVQVSHFLVIPPPPPLGFIIIFCAFFAKCARVWCKVPPASAARSAYMYAFCASVRGQD